MLGNRDSPETMDPFSSETDDREAAFVAFQDATRRAVLRHLDSEEGQVALADLAERVADGDARDPDRLAAALHHNHLPKLAECGLVEYDSRENRVAMTDRESVEPYLGLFED